MTDLLITHAKQLVTVDPAFETPSNPLGVVEDGAMAISKGVITWLGPTREIPEAFQATPQTRVVDASEGIVLPGLIDSHTHPVFAGDRADEYALRQQGVSYQEIAAQGGGILKTVAATRQASFETLFTLAKQRLETMMRFGVTTVEAKSGYGLDAESEWKSLTVLAKLREALPLSLLPTYMGAHDIPPEYRGNTDAYVQQLCEIEIPKVATAGLAVFCDVFCEDGYFTVAQSKRLLEAARNHGLKLKVHANEFGPSGGDVLAGTLQAVSADHLMHITDEGIAAMKAGGTVATLLPGTTFFLRLQGYAPAKKLLASGLPVALATDFNPGSCMCPNLQLIMTLGCQMMGMSVESVIGAVTRNAAMAVDLLSDRGTLAVGKRADWVLFHVPHYASLLYEMGVNRVKHVFIAGKQVV